MDDSPNDTTRQVAPARDEPRQAPPLDPAHFTMTVDDASARFAEAGLPRSVRSIQRYCQRRHLSCTTVDTEISEMYLIDPESVERRIQELQQIEFVTRAPGTARPWRSARDWRRPSGHQSLSARTNPSGSNDLSNERQQKRNSTGKTRRP